jgi:hypothetical protein
MTITVGGTNITLNSGSVLQDPPGSAPSYLCRAWVNFNGTGTVAIRASGNVSSITDNGTGQYTVNFTTAMTDADYCAVVSTENSPGAAYGNLSNTAQTTSGVSIFTVASGAVADNARVVVAIFR